MTKEPDDVAAFTAIEAIYHACLTGRRDCGDPAWEWGIGRRR